MRSLLSKSLFAVPFFFSILLAVTTPSLAEDVGGSKIDAPTEVKSPDPVTLTVNNLPSEGSFYINVYTFNQTCQNGTISRANLVFKMKDDGSCAKDQINNGFSSFSCSGGTFTGVVNPDALGVSEIDGQYIFPACFKNMNDDNYSSDASFTYTVGDPSTNNGMKIDHVWNSDQKTNSPTTGAKAGELIGIRLANAPPGDYTVIIGEPGRYDPQGGQNCVNSDCAVYATLPNDLDQDSISIVVLNKDESSNPFPVYLNTLVQLPTPTPLPPPPPCAIDLTSAGSDGCTSIFSGIGLLSTDSEGFITQLFAILLSLSGGIALLLIIRSGYQIMTSRGEAEKIKEAQERLTSVFVGLLFLVLSLVILEVIGVDLLNLPGLSK